MQTNCFGAQYQFFNRDDGSFPSWIHGYTAKNACKTTWEFRTGISGCKDQPNSSSCSQNTLCGGSLRNWKETELTSNVWQDSNLKNHLLNGGLKARSFCSVWSASIQNDNQAYIPIENLYAAYSRTPVVFPYYFIKAWSRNTCTHHTADCFSCCNHWF